MQGNGSNDMEKIKILARRLKFFAKYYTYNTACAFSNVFCSPSKNTKTNAYVFSCPDHGNAGDIAIEKAQNYLLEKAGRKVEIINVREFLKNFSRVKKELSSNDLVCVQGGGSFGGLYRQADIERLMIFKWFGKNKVISFPQTICFTDNIYIKRYQKVLKKKKNVYLCFREQKSYDEALKYFSFMKERIYLVPDVVFSLKETVKDDKMPRSDFVVVSLRKDKEKGLKNEDELALMDYLNSKSNGKVRCLDTYQDIKGDINKKDEVLDKVLDVYKTSKIVVTDRLHGMILSYITNTPCVAVSNNNGKVRNEYNSWLSDCNGIKFVSSYNMREIKKAIKQINTEDIKWSSNKRIKDGLIILKRVIRK